MRLSSIPRVTGNHRKRWLVANGSRTETGVERKWRLVRGRVVFARQGRKSRRENEDEGLGIFVAWGRTRTVSALPHSKNQEPEDSLVVLTCVCSLFADVFFRLEVGQSR